MAPRDKGNLLNSGDCSILDSIALYVSQLITMQLPFTAHQP